MGGRGIHPKSVPAFRFRRSGTPHSPLAGSDRVRRLRVGGADAVEFGAFDRFGELAHDGLEAGELAALLDHDVVEFLVQAFDVGEVDFDALEALFEFEFGGHDGSDRCVTLNGEFEGVS